MKTRFFYLANAHIHRFGEYPAWQPDPDAELLHRCKKLYAHLFNKEPKIEVIHAGLECGIIGDLYPGMESISLGPTIKHAHSPSEKIYIPSIANVYQFIGHLLAEYSFKG